MFLSKGIPRVTCRSDKTAKANKKAKKKKVFIKSGIKGIYDVMKIKTKE